MRNFSLAGVFLLALSCDAESQVKTVDMDRLHGDWLEQAYLQILVKTRSPAKALKGMHIPLGASSLNFSRKSAWTEWTIVSGFHEFMWYRVTGLKPAGENTYALRFSEKQECAFISEDNRIRLFPDSPDSLEWLFTLEKKQRRIQYIRVHPSGEEYMNGLLLAGEYDGPKGQRYIFESSGRAIWPDKTFNYSLALDSNLERGDGCFIVPTEKDEWRYMAYMFERKNGKLYLYHIHYEGDTQIMRSDPKPLYVLTPKQ